MKYNITNLYTNFLYYLYTIYLYYISLIIITTFIRNEYNFINKNITFKQTINNLHIIIREKINYNNFSKLNDEEKAHIKYIDDYKDNIDCKTYNEEFKKKLYLQSPIEFPEELTDIIMDYTDELIKLKCNQDGKFDYKKII